MTAQRIDGKALAARLQETVAARTAGLGATQGLRPGLAVVLVGSDPASQVYVRSKRRRTAEAGMQSFAHELPEDTGEAALLELIARLNTDPAVHGILVQLPLPAHIDPMRVLAAINPAKDVDGFHVVNAGRLATGQPGLVPCTPLGCMMLLRERHADLSGLHAVVLGRSNIVGKPMAQLLLAENCTVTVVHSRSRDLPMLCRQADILVAAVGRPELVRGDWIRPGATVIDVGINRVVRPDGTARLIGDVAFDEAAAVAGAITPVPGGVGPMTIACLLANTLIASCRQAGLPDPDLTPAPGA
ncbi:bifunctional methylenetetrahydrofolate dehydrogenase/methenyltetrahydrofolate cyclohydrolase FolD [Salipiger abyssi]|uniref:bifunctional methylenetetrahydrofolate dehydrogenase/methenyltetrahydrofolate cyclohydrolase FolD n=1 Tax=Salipiger abyssi TaxID=1250539 RepID=UPI0040591BD4